MADQDHYQAYYQDKLWNLIPAIYRTLDLAARDRVNLAGIVTWAFEFEAQPYFAGYRELASNGLDKPVLNAFRMFGLLGG